MVVYSEIEYLAKCNYVYFCLFILTKISLVFSANARKTLI